jgi:molybdenum cofactor cytidylyltransferase
MVSAVVLAAGASTRMGQHKLLLPLGGEPLLQRTVRQVAEAGFDDLLVVLGFGHEQTRTALEGLGCRITVNLDYETGMGSSFRTAVASLGDSEAALFALADQPFLSPAQYRRLLDIYREQSPGIICSRFGAVTAPPHLFARRLFPELAVLQHGAKPVLQRHRDEMIVVDLPADLLLDVDTPEDYERASKRLSSGL